MKASCINSPPNERMLLIREWQVRMCDGNHCAAALMGFLAYWHDIRLEQSGKAVEQNQMAARHGEVGTQDTRLLQFHTGEQLRAGLLGLWSDNTIKKAREVLVRLGVVTEHRNPNPEFRFDATVHYLFHPEVANAWIAANPSEPATLRNRVLKTEDVDSAKTGNSIPQNCEIGIAVLRNRSLESAEAIPETTEKTGIPIPSAPAEPAPAISTPPVDVEPLPSPPSSPPHQLILSAPAAGSPEASRPKRVQSAAAKAARANRSAAADAAKELTGTAAWDAYEAAYKVRYGIPPVRNKVTASKFKQFAGRLGRDDAPAVARYYVEHVVDQYVVNAMHSAGLLLVNAETYHSRWSLWKAGRPAPATAPAPSASRVPRPESAAHERRMNFAAYMRGENHADDQQRTIDIEAVVRD